MSFSQSILIALFSMLVVFLVLSLLWGIIHLATNVLSNIEGNLVNAKKQSNR